MVVRVLVLGCVFLMSVWPARADLDSGKRALEMGDYGAAYRSLEPLARAGETEA